MKEEFRAPSECPVCGAEVPRGARACPECGADERSGWDEEATRYDELDLPDEAFDDGQTKNQRGERRAVPNGATTFWWISGIVVLILTIYLVLRRVL